MYLHSLVALPHLRFPFSAINTKWEGDFSRPVTFQTRNAKHGTRNTEHGTRNTERDTIPPLFSRTPTSKIHVFCKQHQVGGRLSRPKTFQPLNAEHGTRNIERIPPPFSRTPTSKIHFFCTQHQVGGRLSKTRNLSDPKR